MQRFAFPSHEAVVYASISLQHSTIRGNNLLIGKLHHIARLQLMQAAAFRPTFCHDRNGNWEVSFVVAVEGNGSISALLHSTAHKHEEYNAAHAVQIAVAGVGENLVQAARISNEDSQGDRRID